jgi:hypothetical protein
MALPVLSMPMLCVIWPMFMATTECEPIAAKVHHTCCNEQHSTQGTPPFNQHEHTPPHSAAEGLRLTALLQHARAAKGLAFVLPCCAQAPHHGPHVRSAHAARRSHVHVVVCAASAANGAGVAVGAGVGAGGVGVGVVSACDPLLVRQQCLCRLPHRPSCRPRPRGRIFERNGLAAAACVACVATTTAPATGAAACAAAPPTAARAASSGAPRRRQRGREPHRAHRQGEPALRARAEVSLHHAVQHAGHDENGYEGKGRLEAAARPPDSRGAGVFGLTRRGGEPQERGAAEVEHGHEHGEEEQKPLGMRRHEAAVHLRGHGAAEARDAPGPGPRTGRPCS